MVECNYCDSQYQVLEFSFFKLPGLISSHICWKIKLIFCSQVSYFEIYLDKIRDLLDGK